MIGIPCVERLPVGTVSSTSHSANADMHLLTQMLSRQAQSGLTKPQPHHKIAGHQQPYQSCGDGRHGCDVAASSPDLR